MNATIIATFHNMPTTFEFTKEDITSGAELSGATLTVLDKDGNVVDTWTSKAGEAHVIKKLVVGESYVLREEFAPYGYLKASDVTFTVEDTEEIQSVVMKDEVPTGSIIINKDGEFLTDINLVKGKWYDFVFDYFKKSLAGVTFEVYAREDIVSPDGLDTVYYEADELVATIVTNDKGIAMISDLPLGKYYLVETATIEGFVLDSTPIEAELSYIDQNTKVVYAGMDVTNERQKVQITVIKKDAETKKSLEGAVFGLYAKEDIFDADGRLIVAADTFIEKAVTGADGTVTFKQLYNEISIGHSLGTRIRYIEDETAEDGFRKLTKDEELEILKQEFDDFVDSRFGAEAQAQNAKAAKAMKEIEQLKESLGKGSTSHFESELIPDGFADNLKRETGTYAKRYAGAKII